MLAGSGCATDYKGDDKAHFIARGNAICQDNGATVKPAMDELLNDATHQPTSADLRSFAGDVALPNLQERVDKLRQLVPPSADRGDVDDIIRAYQKGIDQITADPTRLADADPLLEAYSLSRVYGLTSCAR